MKTAEQTLKDSWYDSTNPHDTGKIHTDEQAITLIKQIQLDAYQQGLTDAANLASSKAIAYDNTGCELASQAILTKRDNTTSLP